MRICAIIDSLQAISDPVSKQDHIDSILEGLPEVYNSFVMMIYGGVDPTSVDDEALLLAQDAQFKKYKQELPSSSVLLNVAQALNLQASSSATDSGNFQSSNGYQDPTNGYQGSNHGRGRSGCGRGGRGRDCGGNRPTCQLCHEYGRDTYNCWYRFDQNFVPQPAPAPQFSNPNQFPTQGSFPMQPLQGPSQRPPPQYQPNAFVATQLISTLR